MSKKTTAKKPLFKKWWFWLLIAIVVIGIVGNLGKKPQTEKEEPQTEKQTEASATEAQTEVVELSAEEQIKKIITDRIKDKMTMTDIDSIEINEDLGTDAENDYIVLVNLTWNQKNNGEMSKKVLTMYSEDLAATIGENNNAANEVAVFWTVPYLNANAKCSYQRSGEGFAEMDMMWDSAFES